MFAAGLVVLAAALVGPLDRLAEQSMAAHMVQHILIMSIAPAMLLAGAAGMLSDRALTRPPSPRAPTTVAALCGLGSIGVIWALHAPAVLDPALRAPALNDAQHLLLLGAGVALAWPLVGPSPLRGFSAAAYLVAGELGLGALGIWLAWYPDLLYSAYPQGPRPWGLSAEADQALAGAILLVVEELVLAAEFAVVFIRALGESERTQAEADARADGG